MESLRRAFLGKCTPSSVCTGGSRPWRKEGCGDISGIKHRGCSTKIFPSSCSSLFFYGELSSQVQLFLIENFIGSTIPEAFTWTLVQLIKNLLDVIFRNIRKILSFREIFSQQAVRVLVGSPLPGLMWLREVEWCL